MLEVLEVLELLEASLTVDSYALGFCAWFETNTKLLQVEHARHLLHGAQLLLEPEALLDPEAVVHAQAAQGKHLKLQTLRACSKCCCCKLKALVSVSISAWRCVVQW